MGGDDEHQDAVCTDVSYCLNVVSSQQQTQPAQLWTILGVTAALALTSCSSDDEDIVEHAPEDTGQSVSVGVSVASPGLVSGLNPTEVTGAEVDLVTAFLDRIGTLDGEAEVDWIPTTPDTVAPDLAQLDVAIGQFRHSHFVDDAAHVGPYAIVRPGLLVHQELADDLTPPGEPVAPMLIDELADLEDATVCVVAGSLGAAAALPAADSKVESTVTACEVGLQSGQYDAISADDMQLAGLLLDPVHADRYALLAWEDFADDGAGDVELDERLLTSGSYWLGVDAAVCHEAAETFEELLDDGVLADAFSAFDSVAGFDMQLVGADEVSVEQCETTG